MATTYYKFKQALLKRPNSSNCWWCFATGGTIKAIIKLLKEQGAIIKKVIILLELTDLNGRASINDEGIEIVSLVKF